MSVTSSTIFVDRDGLIPSLDLLRRGKCLDVDRLNKSDILKRITDLARCLHLTPLPLDPKNFEVSQNLLQNKLMCRDGSLIEKFPLAEKWLKIYADELLSAFNKFLDVFKAKDNPLEKEVKQKLLEFLSIYKNCRNALDAILPNLKLIDLYARALEDIEKYMKKSVINSEIFIYLPMACLIKICESDLKFDELNFPVILLPFISEIKLLKEEYGTLDAANKQNMILALDSDAVIPSSSPALTIFLAKVKNLAFRFSREKKNSEVNNFIVQIVFEKRK